MFLKVDKDTVLETLVVNGICNPNSGININDGDCIIGLEGYSTFGKKEPRFTKFNNHVVDIIPEGNILMIENDDKPGVIGLLGNSLGKKNININRLYLSNQKNGNSDSALAFISVDSPVSQDTLEYIANMDEVNSVEQVILD